MNEALRGAGITQKGMPIARNLWRGIEDDVEIVRCALIAGGVSELAAEAETDGFVGRIVGAILARDRYAAAMKAKAKRKVKKRSKPS